MRPTFLTLGFFFSFAAMIVVPGCMCRKGAFPVEVEPPTDVSVGNLVRVYRDTPGLADQTYTGRRIRVTIPADGWREVTGGIGWYTGVPGTPPAVVFLCTPPDKNSSVEVVGVCRGRTFDGHQRGPGIDWCLVVTDCSVIPLPARP